MKTPTLYLIRGVPGSGKSTLARDLVQAGLVKHMVEADQWFIQNDGSYQWNPSQLGEAHEWARDRARNWLTAGDSVAVSNTTVSQREVDVWSEMARETGAQLVSLVVENRHGNSNIHGVPAEKLDSMRQRFVVSL